MKLCMNCDAILCLKQPISLLYSMLGYTGECTYVHVHVYEQYLHINGIPRSVPRILTYIHVFIKLIHSLGVFI